MALLTSLHRWLGATIGLILIVMGLSGTALVWEGSWISVPGADAPASASADGLARSVSVALSHHTGLSRITFAGPELGLHQAAYRDGSGAYIDQSGKIVTAWSSSWERPELWIFDLHHHLFAGEFGELLVGTAGLAGIFFVMSGTILWWRTRKTFAFRLWPKRLTRSAIVRQHRDLGVVLAPLLLIAMITGCAMIFPWLSQAIVAPWPDPAASSGPTEHHIARNAWRAAFIEAKRAFPHAEIRRLQIGKGDRSEAVLRLRQPFEWTPNGRTYIHITPSGRLRIDAPDGTFDKQAIGEKFYPIHAAKVGGWIWKVAITCTGLGLAMLGALAAFCFWKRGNRPS